MPLYKLLVVISLALLAFRCEAPSTSNTSAGDEVPKTNITLPEQLNLRENLLEMRGLTADFTADSWRESGLDVVAPWRPGGSHFILGELKPVPAGVTALLILEDRPEQSTVWAVSYADDRVADYLEVFHLADGTDRTVGGNWRSGRLAIRLDRGQEQYGETFRLDESGKWVPFTEKRAPR